MPPPSMLLTQHNFCSLVTLAILINFYSLLPLAILVNFCSTLPLAALANFCSMLPLAALVDFYSMLALSALTNFCPMLPLAALTNFCSMLPLAALYNFCPMLVLPALMFFYSPHRHHRALIAERLRREARSPATMPLRRSAEMGSVRFRGTTGCEVERPPAPACVVADAATRCFCFGG